MCSFATDEFEGFEVADIDEFEERADTLRLSFSYAPRLFVHDGAVGANREAAIRVRVITDSADYALFARTMLVWYQLHVFQLIVDIPALTRTPLCAHTTEHGAVGEPTDHPAASDGVHCDWQPRASLHSL